jgi:hypothetical protein
MAAALAALMAVRPETPRARAAQLADWMVLHAKREAAPRWTYPDDWARRERIKAAGLSVSLGELADNGFDVAGTCRGCDRTRRGLLKAMIGRNGRAAVLATLKRKLRCASCNSTAIVLAVVDAPKVPPPAWKPWSDRNRK